MSNLQLLARRCPVMGKAMAMQMAKTGNIGLNGAFGGARAYSGKAKLHTTRAQHAVVGTEDVSYIRNGMCGFDLSSMLLIDL